MTTATAQAYVTDSVGTAGPAQLVLALYDGALGAIQRAAVLMAPGDEEAAPARLAPGTIEAVHKQLLKAQRIVTELRVTLDHERGGSIAANLDSLYGFCLRLLVEANLSKDPQNLAPVLEVLRGLREAWAAACC